MLNGCLINNNLSTRFILNIVAAFVFYVSLHCALSLAEQCIAVGPVCVFVGLCVCLWVCYHDNSKLCASILAKLGL